jgi:hypothetical protein
MNDEGKRNPEHGTRNTEPGTRNPEPGTPNTEHGTRNTEHGKLADTVIYLSPPIQNSTAPILLPNALWRAFCFSGVNASLTHW